MADNPFEGAWSLVSFEFRRSDGKISYPYGQNAQGYITYNKDGYMSVTFMNPERPNFNSEDLRGGDHAEKVLAYETYFSYCGKYEIRGKKVIHHLEVSLFPNWTGKDQERFYEFDGDRLILSSPPILVEGVEQTAHLIWKKAR